MGERFSRGGGEREDERRLGVTEGEGAKERERERRSSVVESEEYMVGRRAGGRRGGGGGERVKEWGERHLNTQGYKAPPIHTCVWGNNECTRAEGV